MTQYLLIFTTHFYFTLPVSGISVMDYTGRVARIGSEDLHTMETNTIDGYSAVRCGFR